MIRDPKPRPIILNKNHHFKYKMRKIGDEQVIMDSQKIIKPHQPSHVVARLLSPNNY